MSTDKKIIDITDNVRAVVWNSDDNPHAAIIYFQARAVEEPVSFRITTSAPIISSMWRMPQLRGGHYLMLAESKGLNHYAVSLEKKKFLDQPFIVGVEMESVADAKSHITKAEVWDQTGGDVSLVYIDFENGA